MIDTDVASLRKIAENATPGPWKLSEANNYTGVVSADHRLFIEAFREANGWPSEDLAHIATFNPAAVLALLDRLERAEAAIERVREIHGKEPVNSNYGGTRDICLRCEQSWPCPTATALDTGKEKKGD